MLAHSDLGLGVLPWESWTAPTIGLTSAALMLILALSFLRQRQPAPPRPAAKEGGHGAPFENGSFKERRGAARWRGKITRVLISDAAGTAEPFPGLVYDRSLTGLRISVPHAVEKNRILSVRAVEGETSSDWIQVEVKRCRVRKDGCWELGCQFVRTPPYNQLLLFG
jgi:hypothetical protein